jgi:hypothetical protein
MRPHASRRRASHSSVRALRHPACAARLLSMRATCKNAPRERDGLFETVSCCCGDRPQHEGRRDQPGDVGKRRGGLLPVSGLFFTESCATAARTSDTRIESRGRRCPRSPVLRVSPPSRRPNICDRKQQPAGVENARGPRSIVSDCFYQWKKQLERVRRYAASAFAEPLRQAQYPAASAPRVRLSAAPTNPVGVTKIELADVRGKPSTTVWPRALSASIRSRGNPCSTATSSGSH